MDLRKFCDRFGEYFEECPVEVPENCNRYIFCKVEKGDEIEKRKKDKGILRTPPKMD